MSDTAALDTAFLEAAARGFGPALERLLAQGADVNASHEHGQDGAHAPGPPRGAEPGPGPVTAVHLKMPELVRELLDRGADPNVTLVNGDVTPLYAEVRPGLQPADG